ncbi:MAG: transposase [Oceanospirillaceae bacterium]
MTRAREQQINCADTPYYHCVSRVVRRAFLCGFDQATQQDYEHRRQWVIDRLAEIDAAFCIDICAYAIMSNHYHLVLYINKNDLDALTDLEVIERWRKLYNGPDVIQRYLKGEKLSKEQHGLIAQVVDEWRERLADISWYMRCLNEFIARKANFEDSCKGRFWEGRFKSQALLDEQALLTCMAYVELNPIRAKIADTPETSDYTSVKQRIDERSNTHVKAKQAVNNDIKPRITLKTFLAKGDCFKDQIPYGYSEYLYLVDWSGRAIRIDKRGTINHQLPAILLRLGIDEESWCEAMQPQANHQFSRALGCKHMLQAYAEKLGLGWIKGMRVCSKLFPV